MKITSDDITTRNATLAESRQTDDDTLMLLAIFIDKNISRQRVLNAILTILVMMFRKDFPGEVERMKAIDEIANVIKINASSKNQSGVTQ